MPKIYYLSKPRSVQSLDQLVDLAEKSCRVFYSVIAAGTQIRAQTAADAHSEILNAFIALVV